MKVIKNGSSLKKIVSPVLTLGNFDGLHVGHQKILGMVARRAVKLGAPSVVYTFDPHPMKVVSPKNSPLLLTLLEDKVSLIGSFGIDFLVLARFTRQFASKHPRQFIEEVLVGEFSAREVWVGHDYAFGRGKAGSTEYLERVGRELGFVVSVIPAYKKGGAVVSSSRVRALIREGRVGEASKLLARPFSVKGRVVSGANRGAGLGFPTANLKVLNEIIPANGVYAVEVAVENKRMKGVANIGVAPTFGARGICVEVHIMDFTGNLYGHDVEVAFVRRIRAERAFPTVEKLVQRMTRDVERARGILS